jgi:hypothetical protein
MPIRVEVFGTSGVAIGLVSRAGRLREILEVDGKVFVEDVTWHPLDGSPARPSSALTIGEDDILLAVADGDPAGPTHAQWHDIELDVGPYRVNGQMPTMPGFDPGRALARPTGEFVLLRDVRIALLGDDRGPAVEHHEAFVNRYVVDRVTADMMLGFFFPGAEIVVTGSPQPSAATAAPAVAERPPSPPAPDPSATAEQPIA